jgi:AmmeMemoRadiSam system protein B
MDCIRPAAVAGSWYPGEAAALTRAVDAHLQAVRIREEVHPCPRALVAPHAGLMYSGPVAAYAYALVGPCRYSAAILVGPSHFVGFDGVSIWPRGAWDTPLGPLAVAEDLASAVRAVVEQPAAHGREHSLELQLPFLARLLPQVPIVPLVMGHQTRQVAESLGEAIASAVRRHEGAGHGPVLLVASSDLSHYEDAATASRLDAVVLGCVESLDPGALMAALEHEPRHACGGGPMVSVLIAARALGASQARVLRYADSSGVSGDKSSVVGYMAAGIW